MKKGRIAGFNPVGRIGAMTLSLLMLLGLAACGGKSDPNSVTLEVKPELGDMGNYISINNKEAVISLSEFTDNGEPCIKVASTLQITVKEDVASDYGYDLDVTILDGNMNEITDFGDYDIDDNYDWNNGDYAHILKAGNCRAVMDETGKKSQWEGKLSSMWELIRQNGKYIALKPRWNSAKLVPYTGSAKSSSSESSDDEISDLVVVESEEVASASGSEDWDKILDDYDSYCTKLATYAKKVKAGDMTAMTEYASLLESAQALQTELENAGSNLSVAQANRLNKIAAKMASSLM